MEHKEFSTPLSCPMEKSTGIPMNKPISCRFRSKK